MKIKSKIMVYVFFVTNVMITYGQSTILPPPDASSFLNYITYPVEEEYGTVNIEIPIFKFKYSNNSLSFNLSYHGSGVKLKDRSSHFGLKWSLTCTGIVTRTVRGLPDDIEIYKIDDSEKSYNSYLAGRSIFGFKGYSIPNFLKKIDEDSDPDLSYIAACDEQVYGETDLEPDIYYYKFLDYSGSFYFGENGVVFPEEKNGLKFEYTLADDGQLNSFTIITEDGTIARFSDKEVTTITSHTQKTIAGHFIPAYHSFSYNSSWYLSEIEFVNGQTINYEYEDENLQYFNQKTSTGTPDALDDDTDDVIGYKGQLYFISKENFSLGCYYSDVLSKRLSNVSFPGGSSLHLEAENARQDLIGSRRIDNIKIYSSNDLIKDYKLHYEYVEKTGANETQNKYRLYLMGLSEERNLEHNYSYFFKYYSKGSLPHIESKKKDMWGYYNDNNPNNTAWPYPNAFPELYIYPDLVGYKRFRINPIDSYVGENYKLSGTNRRCNPETCHYGSLEEITYPTGGQLKINYEPNSYLDNNQSISGGGIRVKSMEYSERGVIVNKKEYEYLKEDDSSLTSGILLHRPELVTFINSIDDGNKNNKRSWALGLLRSEEDLSENVRPNGVYVAYSNVKIRESGNGTIEKKYNIGGDYYNNEGNSDFFATFNPRLIRADYEDPANNDIREINTKPFLPPINYDWSSGRLKEVVFYNENGDLVRREEYKYEINDKSIQYLYGFRAQYLYNTVNLYLGGTYQIITNVRKDLVGKKITDYFESGNVLQEESFIYDAYGLLLEHKVKADKTRKVKFKYPNPLYSDLTIFSLFMNNVINKPIEKINYIDDRVVGAEVYNYATIGGNMYNSSFIYGCNFVLENLYQLKINNPINDYEELSEYMERDERCNMVLMREYDDEGNIIEENNLINGLITSFLWGYNNQYPIAKVVNANYSEIESVLNTEVDIFSSATKLEALNMGYYNKFDGAVYTLTENNIRSMLNELRTNLPNAQVYTYTYNPLIGMTSQTDPNGIITYYDYDDFGRLKLVKDHEGSILKSYEYNYAQ